MHRFPEIPVRFPEILLKLTNPTISRRETCLWVSFPLFPAGKLAFTSNPGFSRKISKDLSGKKLRKMGKIAGKNGKRGKIKNKT